MKALVYTGIGHLEMQERPKPEADFIVKVLGCGICGTDLKTYQKGHHFFPPPAVLGHEFFGLVEKASPASGYSIGDPVVVAPYAECGSCPRCRAGAGTLCRSKSFVDGGNFTASAAVSIAERDSWKPAFEFKAGYSFPFSLPVWPRNDLASLSGKVVVIEDGKERPIVGVVVRLNNLVAITGKEGEFAFKGIRPGTYYVEIDGQSIERGLVSVDKLPLKLELKADEESGISLGFLKSSTLRVRVINEEKEPVNLGGIYFTLSNGEENFRLSTRENGEISVPNLRPGKWTLRIDGDTLPRGFVIDNQTAELELKSGSETTIDFKMRKKSEQIIIIDSGVL